VELAKKYELDAGDLDDIKKQLSKKSGKFSIDDIAK
jgi:hypothetical protein